jgi:hypothetical protein
VLVVRFDVLKMVRTSFFVCLSRQAAIRQLQAPQPYGYLTLRIYKQSTKIVGVFVSISDVAGYRLNFCILYNACFPCQNARNA